MSTPLVIPVGQLVAFACRSGDLGMGPTGPSARAGIRAHQKLQRARLPGFEAEARVSTRLDIDQTTIELTGRVDLMNAEAAPPIIGEIKSTFCSPDRLPPAQVALHWAQLKVYAFCHLHGSEQEHIRLEMTWYDLAAERSYVDAIQLDYGILRDFTLTALHHYLRWLEQVQAQREALRTAARVLDFPFAHFRPGQRAMAAEVYRAAREGDQRLIEAPTGIGKTISALFPAAKALGQGTIERVVYLTAKNSGRLAAMAGLETLARDGLPIRFLLLRAKQQVCPCLDSDDEREADGRCARCIGFYDRLPAARKQLLARRALGAEAIDSVAQAQHLCPFELALQMVPWVDIVVCDFNYVFDPLVGLSSLREGSERTLLLLDEAHNLVDRSRQMYSARLRRSDIDASASACQSQQPALGQALRSLSGALSRWQKRHPGEPNIDRAVPATLTRAIERLLRVLDDPARGAAAFPAPLGETLKSLYRFQTIAALFSEQHVCLTRGMTRGRYREVEVKLLCLDASQAMAQCARSFRGMALFSATLSPANYYRDALGLAASSPATSIPSPFEPSRLGVWLSPTIDTRYRHRERHLHAIAATIHAVYSAHPGNYLVFFPSYAFMHRVAEAFNAGFATPTPVLQCRDAGEADRAAFLSHYSEGGQTLGFAMMGGVYGESVDYVGDRLLGAIVVGVGLPAADTEQELIRAAYTSAGHDGFDFAYRFPGLARVLQAAGRVIRSDTDRGVVVLIDQRFSQAQYRRYLPEHWQHRRRCPTPEALQRDLVEFWRQPVQ